MRDAPAPCSFKGSGLGALGFYRFLEGVLQRFKPIFVEGGRVGVAVGIHDRRKRHTRRICRGVHKYQADKQL